MAYLKNGTPGRRRLDGKVAIVTGAGSGIGEATARLMAREGAAVVVADINRPAAERVAGELHNAVAAEVDVSDEPSGAIVNTASIDGLVARGMRTAYRAAKAGVMLATKNVAAQYGPRGIRCNAVAPGMVLTPAVEHVGTPEQIQVASRSYPMPRLCVPEDLANAVVFLASDEAAFVNGTTLMVDGGATAYMPSAGLER